MESVHKLTVLTLSVAVMMFAADGLDPQTQAAIDHIRADSLRGHLSFIASDLLEGRGTPSRGLDIAAEYIAAQFRRAGLEPVGGDGYFQDATVVAREQNPKDFQLTVSAGGETLRVDAAQASIAPEQALDIKDAPAKVNGRVITAGGIALVIGRMSSQTVDPEASRGAAASRGNQRMRAVGGVNSPELVAFLKAHADATMTLHVEPALEHPAKVKNVAGLLRGSDPVLKDTYVLLTAHYDHLGVGFDGANDDGSGTVSVMEIASAIATMNPRPKRSILFMTFFGEEHGLLGSRYYGRHPLEPVSKTIADLNLEQVGRTDATNGPQVNDASITGFDFSDLPKIIAQAGKETGIRVYKDPEASDPYFARSDNQAMADLGVPAHTLCVAFDYPDYHGQGDHWEKVDFVNMAKVDRTVAAALIHVASDAAAPKWNESNPSAAKYVEAAKKLR